MRKKHFVRLLMILYAAALLGCALERLVWNAGMEKTRQKMLDPAQAELISIRTDYGVEWMNYTAEDMLATDNDPQLIWLVEDMVGGLRVRIRASRPVEDVELYCTTSPGEACTLENRLTPVAYDAAQESWLFRLPQAQYVHSLRLDPTSTAGSFLLVEDVELNPLPTLRERLLPPVQVLLTAAAVPPLLALAVREIAGLRQARSGEEQENNDPKSGKE